MGHPEFLWGARKSEGGHPPLQVVEFAKGAIEIRPEPPKARTHGRFRIHKCGPLGGEEGIRTLGTLASAAVS